VNINEPTLQSSILEGHPIYKWDQEKVLKHLFGLIDKKNLGFIDFKSFSKALSDKTIQRHLRFTIMGSWIKLKSWDMFQAIFNVQNSELYSNNIDKKISCMELIEATRSAIYEDYIPSKYVRTLEEHRGISLNQSLNSFEEFSPKYYAELSRNALFRSQRDSIITYHIKKGDLVWGLYAMACEWLPAEVREVNNDGTYDLKYLLTEVEITIIRNNTASRKLLYSPPSEDEICLDMSDVINDKRLLEKTFDIIDTDKLGYLNAHYLLDRLKDSFFEKIVQASVSLSLLLHYEQINFQKFLIECSGKCSDLISSTNLNNISPTYPEEINPNIIYKDEFIAFCNILSDIMVFNFK